MRFNENQQRAIDMGRGNYNVIATAGSGKTGTLVNRIKNLIEKYGIPPKNILAITFSKKAKETMTERLATLIPAHCQAVHVDTFHSFGYRLIRQFGGGTFTVLDEYAKLKLLGGVEADGKELNKAIRYISTRKNQLEPPLEDADDYREAIYSLYEQEKSKLNALDFDDMLMKSYELLHRDKSVLNYCTNLYKFILIDETQDMNKAQYEIVKVIGKPNNNMFIVNDPLQNIYEWRGSNSRYVLDFHKEWENVSVINLDVNYRSTKDIVRFANNFAKTIQDSGHEFYVESKAERPGFKQPALTVYGNEFDEAYGIADRICELVETEQYDYKDFAVLARVNAQLQIFETAFYNRGLPCSIVNGVSFVDSREIKLILGYLRLANNLNDDEAFEYIYNKPNRWLGRKFLDNCRHVCDADSLYFAMFKVGGSSPTFRRGIGKLSGVIGNLREHQRKNVREHIRYLRKTLSIDDFVSKDICEDSNDNERIENLNSLERIAEGFTSISEFVDYAACLSAVSQSDGSRINLSTIHRSKGLEFPVVFLAGLNEGILPHVRNENIEEEKRLTYVAITRAEKELYCSYLKEYMGKPREMSQFIEPMFGVSAEKPAAKSRRRKRRQPQY